MERLTISKLEKQTIYEIYRACRICGAGGGYRMPIIQNIVDLGTSDVELRQKIQDCLQLEVRSDDRMPPLICELCVDKVNDFYEFMKLSRQTNIRTRTRLGLPLQVAKKSESNSGDCVLGGTKPVCADKPAPKKSLAGPKCYKNNIKKEQENVNIEVEAPSPVQSRSSSVSSRSSRTARRAPTPPRPARGPKTDASKTIPVALEKIRVKEKEKEQEKGIEAKDFTKPVRGLAKELDDLLQDHHKYDDNLLVPRAMKRKETEPPTPAITPKRTRAAQKEPIKEPVEESLPPRRKPGPKSRQVPREDPKSREAPKEDPKSRLALKEDPKSRLALKEDPKSRQAVKEDPKSRQAVREDPKSRQAVKEGPKSRPAPKEDPKSRQVLKEDPKSRQAPKENLKIPVPLKIAKSKVNVAPTPPKVEEPPAKVNPHCLICDVSLKTNAALTNHMKTHQPTYTKPQYACNPCGKWFVTAEEATVHHRYHRAVTFPYHCRRCFEDYKSLSDYDSHISNGLCMPYDLIPDEKCERCWRTFITRTLLDGHKCQGVEGRPGGDCPKCSRSYLTQKTLKVHLRSCNYKKPARDLIADPDVLRRLKPMQVRMSRCDDLLARRCDGRVDASAVRPIHGLDMSYLYPYMRFKPVKPKYKPKPASKLNLGPIRDENERETYTHWDSDDSDSDSVIKKVDSLATLCLKKIFSKNMLGKVPRKKRKVENDAFDSVNDFSISSDIKNIISSLNDDLRDDSVRRNRKDSLIAIAINDIIGVPNFVPNFKLGNENVARSSNDVHIDDKNENYSNLWDSNESLIKNDSLKDLNIVEIENEGTETVVSASDISTELHLLETEDQQIRVLTRNEAASERMGDDMEANDSKTLNNLDYKHKDENVELNNDEIPNFISVDGQSKDDNLKNCNETKVQNNHLSTDDDYRNAELIHSENNIDGDNQNKSDNVDFNNDLEKQDSNTDNAIPNNDSEMSNDNLDIRNNCKNIDVNNDVESQNSQDENKNPDDTETHNDNLGTENNYDSPVNNNSKSKNAENEDMQYNSEPDIQNDNFNMNHTDIKSNDGNDMNNYLENQNESINAVNVNSKTNTHNAYMNSNIDSENNDTQLHGIGNETENSEVSEKVLEELSFIAQNTTEKELSAVSNVHENDTNHNFGESKKSEETKKITNESPIKHSIENLIGDTFKNPDKYIDEVISSIEDIINKNPRREDTNDNFTNGENSNQMDDHILMDSLDTEIDGSKDKTDNEKITLDDLLPKDNTSMELDDISDDDFNFDA